MKKFTVLTGLTFLYLIYGLYLAQYDVRILPEELVAENPKGFLDYKGVTNVHTRLSTGSGEVTEVIAAAQAAGLDFISFTDLNVFDKPMSLAGYHSNLLVMMDGEYSYVNAARKFYSRIYFPTVQFRANEIRRSVCSYSPIR